MISTPTTIKYIYNIEDYDTRYIVINEDRLGEITRHSSIPLETVGAYSVRIYGSKSQSFGTLKEAAEFVESHFSR